MEKHTSTWHAYELATVKVTCTYIYILIIVGDNRIHSSNSSVETLFHWVSTSSQKIPPNHEKLKT
jgi:hypothetical protein